METPFLWASSTRILLSMKVRAPFYSSETRNNKKLIINSKKMFLSGISRWRTTITEILESWSVAVLQRKKKAVKSLPSACTVGFTFYKHLMRAFIWHQDIHTQSVNAHPHTQTMLEAVCDTASFSTTEDVLADNQIKIKPLLKYDRSLTTWSRTTLLRYHTALGKIFALGILRSRD